MGAYSLYMKKPIAIISTDWHLNENNAVELFDIVEQEIALAKEKGVNDVIWLGDVFDSRISQRQELLVTLSEWLQMYSDAGLRLHIIPGNHDKTDYTDDSSFLSPYKYHPNVHLMETPQMCVIGGLRCTFVPYYAQDVWLKKFEEAQAGDLLFSHQAVQGSINNDGSIVNNSIPTKLFKGFTKVFLGHYHNAQQPAKNVFHLQSVRQNNYGENEEKGFTVLYSDTSFEFVKSVFTPFREIKIDVASATPDVLAKVVKMGAKGVNLRVLLVGDVQTVKSIDRKKFTEAGIAVKTKYTDVEVEELDEAVAAQNLTDTDILAKFKKFCEDKNYDYETGYKLLKEIMQWQQE